MDTKRIRWRIGSLLVLLVAIDVPLLIAFFLLTRSPSGVKWGPFLLVLAVLNVGIAVWRFMKPDSVPAHAHAGEASHGGHGKSHRKKRRHHH